jgi:hypothetical protein
MCHNPTVRPSICRRRIRVFCMNEKHDSIKAGVTSSVNVVPIQQRKLVKRLAFALVTKGELLVVAEYVGEATCRE